MAKLIAETAWHHEGDIGFMRGLVREIGESGAADILKMHVTLDLDEYMSADHDLYPALRGMLFDEGQWAELVALGRSYGLEIMLLANDTRAVEFAAEVGADLLEIHALCMGDPHLLDSTRRVLPDHAGIVLGIGGVNVDEIRWALGRLDRREAVLMFGFQNYPTRFERVNFARMRRIMPMFPGCRFGYADHCAWDEPHGELITLLGAALGVDLVEKHVTTNPGQERVDFQAAISIDQLRSLRQGLDLLQASEGSGALELSPEEVAYAEPGRMKKVAVLEQAVARGEELSLDKISFRRVPMDAGLPGPEVQAYLGRPSSRDLPSGHVLQRDDVQDVTQ